MTADAEQRPDAPGASAPEPSLDDGEIERLLERMASGDDEAAERLFPVVYRELHRIAHHLMGGERKGHTLQTTALVHEAWLRLRPTEAVHPSTRIRFLGLAARAMRRVLIDHARARAAGKRDGGARRALFDDMLECTDVAWTDLIVVDDALTRLGEEDPTLRLVVELRYYGGLSLEEIGAVLDLSVRQVRRRWTIARGWLRLHLAEEDSES